MSSFPETVDIVDFNTPYPPSLPKNPFIRSLLEPVGTPFLHQQIFGDPRLTTHRCHIIELQEDSFRFKESMHTIFTYHRFG